MVRRVKYKGRIYKVVKVVNDHLLKIMPIEGSFIERIGRISYYVEKREVENIGEENEE